MSLIDRNDIPPGFLMKVALGIIGLELLFAAIVQTVISQTDTWTFWTRASTLSVWVALTGFTFAIVISLFYAPIGSSVAFGSCVAESRIDNAWNRKIDKIIDAGFHLFLAGLFSLFILICAYLATIHIIYGIGSAVFGAVFSYFTYEGVKELEG